MFSKLPSRAVRLLVLGSALVVALGVPTVALADTTGSGIQPAASNGATIRVTGGAILGRVVANAGIDFTCEPFLAYDWETGTQIDVTTGSLEYGSVTIIQASGRTVNTGFADLFGGTITCDGATVNHRDVAVVAGSVPWRNGAAVAGASVFIVGPDWEQSHSASTGPVEIKLGR